MRTLRYPGASLIGRVANFTLISALCFGVAGCFAGDDPLIAANASDHPLAAGTQFTEATNCAAMNLGCDGQTGYRPIANGSIEMDGGQYVLRFDPGSNTAFSFPAAQGANGPTVLFKSIGEDLYIAQLDSGPPDAAVGGDALPRYLYELVRMEGSNLYIYKYMCEENGDLKYVKSGLLKSVTSVIGSAVCRPSDLHGLADVFRARLANGLPPSERLEIKTSQR